MTLRIPFTRSRRCAESKSESSDEHEEVKSTLGMSDEAYRIYAQIVRLWQQDPEGYARMADNIRRSEERRDVHRGIHETNSRVSGGARMLTPVWLNERDWILPDSFRRRQSLGGIVF